MLELVAGAAVGLAALAVVLEPLFRGVPARVASTDDDDPVPLDEVDSPKLRALVALKEIEFDRATGKLSDEDYERLRVRYSAEAVAAMHAEQPAPSPATPAAPAADEDAEALIRRARTARRVCPRHGPRPEADAVFCSECGGRLDAWTPRRVDA